MRDRGSCILMKDKKIALIKRIRDGMVYYVFPGGGIEKGETPEEATKREAFEELGVSIIVKDCFAEVSYNGIQYFFIADIIEGKIGDGQGEEYTDSARNRGVYQPMWVEINDLLSLDIRPIEVAKKAHAKFA
ncbi:NUDIX domain-containing protein [Lysinibacillus sp. SGAir0095]|uniref:NUDIX hydrolase n=1 Tax=Lysinibacillus sp. SGAir0095 TaxID=2070463 RepID=UPI0010CCE483|nr:NUDIX domain-containing protein [Lysinibacillus sp. SGAir0095]QCR33902.1 DNA mismatch repair protein MutT [Lysinibacillus sp. SGAir0095]